MSVSYFWRVEETTCGAEPEIVDVAQFDACADAVRYANHMDSDTDAPHVFRVCLVRETVKGARVECEYAYVEAGTMPERFKDADGDDGAKVPASLVREFVRGLRP